MDGTCYRRGGYISIYTSLATIDITPEQFEACQQFALRRMPSSEQVYKARGENNPDKIVSDIVNGTVAEFAVKTYLTSKGYECTDPDLTIHDKKSFSADLVCDNKFINVKAQTKSQAVKYSESWIFQTEDSTLTLPSERGYGFFCIVDGSRVEIKAAVYLIDILEADAISKPKVTWFAKNKSAIYLKDLINKNINIRRF